jgi:hypothetical protein
MRSVLSPRRCSPRGEAFPGHAHADRIGVAEQIVDVAQRFLIGADHEQAEQIGLACARCMHGAG